LCSSSIKNWHRAQINEVIARQRLRQSKLDAQMSNARSEHALCAHRRDQLRKQLDECQRSVQDIEDQLVTVRVTSKYVFILATQTATAGIDELDARIGELQTQVDTLRVERDSLSGARRVYEKLGGEVARRRVCPVCDARCMTDVDVHRVEHKVCMTCLAHSCGTIAD
jgi:chaperonin cofactor prefoldin